MVRRILVAIACLASLAAPAAVLMLHGQHPVVTDPDVWNRLCVAFEAIGA